MFKFIVNLFCIVLIRLTIVFFVYFIVYVCRGFIFACYVLVFTLSAQSDRGSLQDRLKFFLVFDNVYRTTFCVPLNFICYKHETRLSLKYNTYNCRKTQLFLTNNNIVFNTRIYSYK